MAERAGEDYSLLLDEWLGLRHDDTQNGFPEKRIAFGAGNGTVTITSDFDALLADFKEYAE